MEENKDTQETTNDSLQTAPHGTIDITGSTFYQRQGFIENAQKISMYYGFEPIDTPIIEYANIIDQTLETEKHPISSEIIEVKSARKEKYVMRPEFTSSVIRSIKEHNIEENQIPLLYYSFGPIFRKGPIDEHHLLQFTQFNLEIIGAQKPISAAVIVVTIKKILETSGAKDIFVKVNSLGNQQSKSDYRKALKEYYKKHQDKLQNKHKKLLEIDPLLLLDTKHKALEELNENAPQSIQYISNQSKEIFMSTLEYLEEAQIPYEIDKTIVRGLPYYNEFVFEVFSRSNPDVALAGGGMYQFDGKKIGLKSETVEGCGAAIGVERIITSPWWNKLMPRIIKPSKIYFIQAGYKAKLKSISVIEELRKANIPVNQSISTESISKQIEFAKKTGSKIAIILGQKEVVDGTIIVRNLETMSQKTIPQSELVKYLRSLKI